MDEASEQEQAQAVRALKDVVKNADAPRDQRVRACDLLARHADQADIQTMTRDVDAIRDPYVKIALLRLLRVKAKYRPSERGLQEFLASDDRGVQCEAALALAEIGNIDAARPILSRLKDEPTERGRRAAAWLERDRLETLVEKTGGLEGKDEILALRNKEIARLGAEVEELKRQVRSGVPQGGGAAGEIPGQKLLGELFSKIRDQYVDEKKTDIKKLIDQTASGLVDHLDPFSSYMNEEEVTDFNGSIRQQYGGIGAVVQMDPRSGYLTIQRPIYGNPAHKAGLRTFDQIMEVEGQPTKGKTVQEIVNVLKGPPGTAVTIKVKPFLGGEEKTMPITRAEITMPSTRVDLIPGGLGYIQLAQFGALASQEVEEALTALEGRGVRGVILDLRDNPGGLLSGAVEVADKFLDDDKLVCYSEGRKGTRFGTRSEDGGPQVALRRRQLAKHPDYPVVVLVNEHSASASEIVSGALQAPKRALLVGRTTFGKGSVQNIFPLESTGEKSALRMTIAYYYLPDGRCIHRDRDVETWRFVERMRMEIERWKQEGVVNEQLAKQLLEDYEQGAGGVEPDYKVEMPTLTPAKQKAYITLLELHVIEDYLQERWNQHKQKFHELALHDAFEAERYPDFDKLWATVQGKLDDASKAAIEKNDVRILVRGMVRRFAQDDLARVFTSDWQEDRQLQAAIAILAGQSGLALESVPELAFIKKVYPDGVTRTRQPPAPAAPGAPNGNGNGGRNFQVR
jgi:C-terminal peptidase prc